MTHTKETQRHRDTKTQRRTVNSLLLALLCVCVSLCLCVSLAAAQDRTFLNQYCITCHNEKSKIAGLMLDKMDSDHLGEQAETWEKVVRKLRTGMMPPSGARRPE